FKFNSQFGNLHQPASNFGARDDPVTDVSLRPSGRFTAKISSAPGTPTQLIGRAHERNLLGQKRCNPTNQRPVDSPEWHIVKCSSRMEYFPNRSIGLDQLAKQRVPTYCALSLRLATTNPTGYTTN
ncbi:hypothetical protein PTTG_27121, partial [Puccinia triticina 1-1 BBBD Race 1]